MTKPKKANRKPKAEQKVVRPIYKGVVVVNEFSIKNKTYKLGDEYSTYNKFNYDTLIKQKRIK